MTALPKRPSLCKIHNGPWRIYTELPGTKHIVLIEGYPSEKPTIEVVTEDFEVLLVIGYQSLEDDIKLLIDYEVQQSKYTRKEAKRIIRSRIGVSIFTPEQISDAFDVDFREITKQMQGWWTVLNTIFQIQM